jgi:hypothetical protein
MSQQRRAEARVSTERPERWVKQLVSHLGRRLSGSVDEATGVGRLTGEGMAATLTPADGVLVLEAAADDDERLERITGVVGSHLERFAAATEELRVEWRPAG